MSRLQVESRLLEVLVKQMVAASKNAVSGQQGGTSWYKHFWVFSVFAQRILCVFELGSKT